MYYGYGGARAPQRGANLYSYVDRKVANKRMAGPDWAANLVVSDWVAKSARRRAPVAAQVIKQFLRRKHPRRHLLILYLAETLMKNGSTEVYAAMGTKGMLKLITSKIRRSGSFVAAGAEGAGQGHTQEVLKAMVSNKALSLVQGWGLAFSKGPLSAQHPIYYSTYRKLRRKGVVFPPPNDADASIITPQRRSAVTERKQRGANLTEDVRSVLESVRETETLLRDMLVALSGSQRPSDDDIIPQLHHKLSQQDRHQITELVTRNATNEALLGTLLMVLDRIDYTLAMYGRKERGEPEPHPNDVHSDDDDDRPPPASASPGFREEDDDDDDYDDDGADFPGFESFGHDRGSDGRTAVASAPPLSSDEDPLLAWLLDDPRAPKPEPPASQAQAASHGTSGAPTATPSSQYAFPSLSPQPTLVAPAAPQPYPAQQAPGQTGQASTNPFSNLQWQQPPAYAPSPHYPQQQQPQAQPAPSPDVFAHLFPDTASVQPVPVQPSSNPFATLALQHQHLQQAQPHQQPHHQQPQHLMPLYPTQAQLQHQLQPQPHQHQHPPQHPDIGHNAPHAVPGQQPQLKFSSDWSSDWISGQPSQ